MNVTPAIERTQVELLSEFLDFSENHIKQRLNHSTDADIDLKSGFYRVLRTWVSTPMTEGDYAAALFDALPAFFSDYRKHIKTVAEYFEMAGVRLTVFDLDLLGSQNALVYALDTGVSPTLDALIDRSESLWLYDLRFERFIDESDYYVHDLDDETVYRIHPRHMDLVRRVFNKKTNEAELATFVFSKQQGLCLESRLYVHSKRLPEPDEEETDDTAAESDKALLAPVLARRQRARQVTASRSSATKDVTKNATVVYFLNASGVPTEISLDNSILNGYAPNNVMTNLTANGLVIVPKNNTIVAGSVYFDHISSIQAALTTHGLIKIETRYEMPGWTYDPLTKTQEHIRNSHPAAAGALLDPELAVCTQRGKHEGWKAGFRFALKQSKFLQFFACLAAGSYLRGYKGEPLIHFSPIAYLNSERGGGKTLLQAIIKTLEGRIDEAQGGGSTKRGMSRQFSAVLNHGPVLVDEISQFKDGKTTQEFISALMELANGSKRVTATTGTDVRVQRGYQVVLMLTGNMDLEGLLAASNDEQAGALRSRLLTINADKLGYTVDATPLDEVPSPIFKMRPGTLGPQIFGAGTPLSENYGTAYPRIIDTIVLRGEELKSMFSAYRTALISELSEVSSQVGFIDRFVDPLALAEVGRIILSDPSVMGDDGECFDEFDDFVRDIKSSTIETQSSQENTIWLHQTLTSVITNYQAHMRIYYTGLFTPNAIDDASRASMVAAHNADIKQKDRKTFGFIQPATIPGVAAKYIQKGPEDWRGLWRLTTVDYTNLQMAIADERHTNIDFSRLMQVAESLGVLTIEDKAVRTADGFIRVRYTFNLDKAAKLAEDRRHELAEKDEGLMLTLSEFEYELPGFREVYEQLLMHYARPVVYDLQSWNYPYVGLLPTAAFDDVMAYRDELRAKLKGIAASGGSTKVRGKSLTVSAEERKSWLAWLEDDSVFSQLALLDIVNSKIELAKFVAEKMREAASED